MCGLIDVNFSDFSVPLQFLQHYRGLAHKLSVCYNRRPIDIRVRPFSLHNVRTSLKQL
jgi:hypothetical protein